MTVKYSVYPGVGDGERELERLVKRGREVAVCLGVARTHKQTVRTSERASLSLSVEGVWSDRAPQEKPHCCLSVSVLEEVEVAACP